MERIYAPFTPAQVKNLNEFQQDQSTHPFTCGNNRTDANHLDGEGRLVATEKGWICPYCNYTQNWAHAGMARPLVTHQFQGRSDRWCEICALPDRHRIHSGSVTQ